LALHTRFAKQNNKNHATAAAPNAQGLLQFEENFSALQLPMLE
jgi:hypothetical protein